MFLKLADFFECPRDVPWMDPTGRIVIVREVVLSLSFSQPWHFQELLLWHFEKTALLATHYSNLSFLLLLLFRFFTCSE